MAHDLTTNLSPSFDSLVLPSGIPELENGDRLTRAEFERRYAAMPDVKKAELIEGVVHMPSAVRVRRHGRPHAHLIHWMTSYSAETPGVEVADNSSNRLDLDNEVQPDGMLFILPECGGQARISDDDYVEGAAELLGEVAASSASHDLGTKLDVYRRNGVREYIVWRVLEKAIDWFVLREGKHERLPTAGGVFHSDSLPGLWLDPAAMIAGNLSRVTSVLREGLASKEHQQFVERLQERVGFRASQVEISRSSLWRRGSEGRFRGGPHQACSEIGNKMTQHAATYIGVDADYNHGEGRLFIEWPDALYGFELLTVDFDGFCWRRMPIHSGQGPPEYVELTRDRLRLRFDPQLAAKLNLDEELDVLFSISDDEFLRLRRWVEFWQ